MDLVTAQFPDEVCGLAALRRAALDDPVFREIYRAYDTAVDWEPDDPRLIEVADACVRYLTRQETPAGAMDPDWEAVDPALASLLVSIAPLSATTVRLDQLVRERMPPGPADPT